jgi:nitrogen fixation protein FixH
MTVIARCPECGGPVGPSDLEAENENLRDELRDRGPGWLEAQSVRQQLRRAVDENEKLRLQVAALENDGMELAAKLGEAEEQIARLIIGYVRRDERL